MGTVRVGSGDSREERILARSLRPLKDLGFLANYSSYYVEDKGSGDRKAGLVQEATELI